MASSMKKFTIQKSRFCFSVVLLWAYVFASQAVVGQTGSINGKGADRKSSPKTEVAEIKLLASSIFHYAGKDGWKTTGDAYDFKLVNGHLQASDRGTGDYWHFSAPQKFLGDKKAAYGGLLLFELNQIANGSKTFHDHVLVLSDGKRELFYTVSPAKRSVGWVKFRIELVEGKGWTAKPEAKVDKRMLVQVLSNLKQLKINCEHTSAQEIGGLRNVRLYSVTSDCARYRKLMNDLAFEIQMASGSSNKTVGQMFAESKRVVSELTDRKEEVTDALIAAYDSIADAQKLLKENDDMSINPYNQKKLIGKGAVMGTSKALVKKLVARRFLLALGLAVDAIEAGNNLRVKIQKQKAFTEMLTRGKLAKDELRKLHQVLSAELHNEKLRLAKVTELKTEYENAYLNYGACRSVKSGSTIKPIPDKR